MNRSFYIIFALIIIAALSGTQNLWGIDSISYLNYYLIFLLLLPSLIISLPPVYNKVNQWLIPNLMKLNSIPILVFVPIFAILFFFFRQEGYFLGDGLLRIRDLETGQIYFAAEPFDLIVHTFSFKFLHEMIGVGGSFVYASISIITGLISISFSILIIRKISSDSLDRVLLFLMIISSGTIQLFFGYAESYSIINAILLPLILFSVLLIKEMRFSYVPMIIWTISIFFHPIMIIFLPSLACLYFQLISNNIKKGKLIINSFLIILVILTLCVAVLLALGVKMHDLNKLTSVSHIKPLLSNEPGYGLISIYTLIDLFNLMVLVVPSALLLFNATYRNSKNIAVSKPKLTSAIKLDRSLTFLIITVISGLLFVFIFESGLGFSRDWDLFSIIGFPSTILVFFLLKAFNFDSRSLFIPIILIIIVQTTPWIISNSQMDYALKRANRMAESPSWSDQEKAILLDELSHYHYSVGNLEAAIPSAEKSYMYRKNERVLYSIGLMYFNKADFPKAYETFISLRETDYMKKNVLMMLGDVSFKMKNFRTAIDTYNQYLLIDSLNQGIYFNNGMAYYQLKIIDSALIFMKASAYLNPGHVPSYSMIAQIYSDIDYLDSAIYYYNKLIDLEPANPDFYYNLALCYSDKKMYEEALDYAFKAKNKGLNTNLVEALITELKKYTGDLRR